MNGVAMTDAERKAKSRAGQQSAEIAGERQNIIKQLMEIYRRQQSDILDDPKRPKQVARYQETARNHERSYLAGLNKLSIAELKLALEVAQAPDTHGRLHNERSGEGKREYGQSEIERILGARQHDSSLFDGEVEQDPLLAAGFKVKPENAGPDDRDSDSESYSERGSAKPKLDKAAHEKWVTLTIELLVKQMGIELDAPPKACPFCADQFTSGADAENHLTEQFHKGSSLADKQIEIGRLLNEITAMCAMQLADQLKARIDADAVIDVIEVLADDETYPQPPVSVPQALIGSWTA